MSLWDWVLKQGFSEEDLDGLVHDAASKMASTANNEGLRGQLAFLKTVCGWSDDDIRKALTE